MKRQFSVLNWQLLLLVLMFLVQTSFAQQQQQKQQSSRQEKNSVRIEKFQLDSKLMNRQMPYRVIFPRGYDAAAKENRYPVIYLLHGFGGHFDNWADKTKLAEYAASFDFLIVMPEGENGWYTDNPAKPNDRYESYIVQELIPEVDKNFRTLAARESRVIGGLSMGGFGALKFGLKYPDKFILAGSFSGAVAASSYRKLEELPPGALRDSIVGVFGEPGSEAHRANNLFKMVGEAPPEKLVSLPFLYLSCGTEDQLMLLPLHRAFTELLAQRKIPHEYRQLPGGHNWVFWNAQALEFLRLADALVKAKSKL